MLSIDTHASCATCGRYRGCTNVVGDVWAFYYCPQCANCMQHLCIADAALLASVSRLTVYWWVSGASPLDDSALRTSCHLP
jgi:hypothetical protein